MMSKIINRLYGKRLIRKPPQTLATTEDFKGWKILKNNTSLNTAKEPAVVNMALLQDMIVCAGNDGTVSVLDGQLNLKASLKAFKQKVTSVQFIDNSTIISCAGGVKMLQLDNTKKLKVLKEFEVKATDISVHPSKKYFLSCGMGWTLVDIESGSALSSGNLETSN